ncbi:MAG: hypothetical protein AB1505_14160 [Candidatus Latescibacterota bacterium]
MGLHGLGAVGAIAAAITGNWAAAGVPLRSKAVSTLAHHEDGGEWTAWLFGLLAPMCVPAHWAHADRIDETDDGSRAAAADGSGLSALGTS